MKFTVQQVAQALNGSFEGDGQAELFTVGKIENAKQGELAFLSNPGKYAKYLQNSGATAVLIPEDYILPVDITTNAALIRVKDVHAAIGNLLRIYAQTIPKPTVGVSDQAFIHPTAEVHSSVHIGPFVYIGEKAIVGANTIIQPFAFVGGNCTIGEDCLLETGARLLHDCQIGNRVRLLANCVVGSDGFGHNQNQDGSWIRIPHLGNVHLHDDVEIGANATVDRAVMGSTILHKGVKLDNLVMVAHNVVLGQHTAAAAQVGIAGSAKLGERIKLGGQVGVAGHLTVANDVSVGAQSGIKDDCLNEGEILFGSPAIPLKKWAVQYNRTKKLPNLQKQVNQLSQQVKVLTEKLNELTTK